MPSSDHDLISLLSILQAQTIDLGSFACSERYFHPSLPCPGPVGELCPALMPGTAFLAHEELPSLLELQISSSSPVHNLTPCTYLTLVFIYPHQRQAFQPTECDPFPFLGMFQGQLALY